VALRLPTYSVLGRFRNEYRQLRADERRMFRVALRDFIRALRAWEAGGCQGVPRFPNHLGVHHITSNRNILAMAWAPDGRCTWEFGTRRRPGKCHVVWRRIGPHAIYGDP
jgi:hypothetical protein